MNPAVTSNLSTRMQPKARQFIEFNAHADMTLCWTCSTCDSECPVNIATNRLRPQKILRLANLGFLDELITLPDIWYCLTCRKCNRVCPNQVRPESVIQFARRQALACNVVPHRVFRQYLDLFQRFQRVRWRAAQACREGELEALSESQWKAWLDTPVLGPVRSIAYHELFSGSAAFRGSAAESKTANCFTCGECSSACPVSGERSVFDPRFLFRAINLGLQEELLHSPGTWLCIGCGRCTDACSQLVDGRAMIAALQGLALETGAVGQDFHWRLNQANKIIFPRLLDEIDKLLGLTAIRRDIALDCNGIKRLGNLADGTCARLVKAGAC
jgi:heterodisulfide reductase subunit C